MLQSLQQTTMNYIWIFDAGYIPFSNCELLEGKGYILFILIITTMKDEYNFTSIQANKEISKEIKFMIPFDSY